MHTCLTEVDAPMSFGHGAVRHGALKVDVHMSSGHGTLMICQEKSNASLWHLISLYWKGVAFQMQYGKISYNAFDRSIKKVIVPRRVEVLQGVGLGNHGAILASHHLITVSENPVLYMQGLNSSAWITAGFYRCINDTVALGSEAFALEAVILLPPDMIEESFRSIIACVETLCRQENMEYIGGHTETVYYLKHPVLILTVLGKKQEEMPQSLPATDERLTKKEVQVIADEALTKKLRKQRRMYEKPLLPRAGQQLVMTKFAGAETAALLADTFEARLGQRYTKEFLLGAADYLKSQLSAVPEAEIAKKQGITAMHNISSGGVFGALWEMADRSGLGLEVDMRKIPVLQDTVEICEFFGLNLYQLSSCGAMLFACDNGEALVSEFRLAGIPASMIGRFTEEKAKCLFNEDEVRFLERPAADELQALLQRMEVEY